MFDSPTSEVYKQIQLLAQLMMESGLKLVTAESCTGGMLSHWITAFPGSSAWFECGFITYSNDSKVRILGIEPDTLNRYGAVSVQVAEKMALGALDHSLANLAVSITGIAGPSGGTETKPTGTVYISSARKGQPPCTEHHVFHGDRTAVRERSAMMALRFLISQLEERSKPCDGVP